MARSKFAHARYKLINRELRRRNWVKTSELKQKIESELGESISTRQIEKDLEAMRDDSYLNYNAPIEYSTRNKAYRYTERSFNIEKFDLADDEMLALKFYAARLNQYKDHGIFRDFSNAIQKVF